jgi:hypothetical protein
MTKKQTSVKWLQEAMQKKLKYELSPSFLELFEQAKALEKEQMIQFAKGWMWNIELSDIDKTLEQYYNETFEA